MQMRGEWAALSYEACMPSVNKHLITAQLKEAKVWETEVVSKTCKHTHTHTHTHLDRIAPY